MSDAILTPISKPFKATISPPGSKSMTNRALVLAVLAAGRSTLHNVLFADDTRVMLDNLRELGFELGIDEPKHTVVVGGKAGKISVAAARLFCGNSGTTIRFLTALCALGKGEFILDGIERMRERPIGELGEMLRHLGGRVRYLEKAGFPPVLVHGDELPGGMLRIATAQSSQFLSSILMVSPYVRHEVRVELLERQGSWPYVTMTMRMMDSFGVTPELIRDPITSDPKEIIVPTGHYTGQKYSIEPDASNAAYFLAAAAVHPGSSVTVPGLGKHSLQGDVGFADLLVKMGASAAVGNDSIVLSGGDELRGIDVDLSAMPDVAQPLAVVALFADGRTTLRGLASLRVKETDRVAALSNELTKLGAAVTTTADTLQIDAPIQIKPAEIATYDDHRMAMSFALAATRSPGIVIKDAQCVNKTYPNYFEDLKRVLGEN